MPEPQPDPLFLAIRTALLVEWQRRLRAGVRVSLAQHVDALARAATVAARAQITGQPLPPMTRQEAADVRRAFRKPLPKPPGWKRKLEP